MLITKRLLVGILSLTLLVVGCKSNKEQFTGLSSTPSDESEKDGIDVVSTTERSTPVLSKGDTSMPEVFQAIKKDDFLTQVSDSEKSVYGLDQDNIYDYYRLTIDNDNGMRCTQYLAMGKRVWSKLKRLTVSAEKNRLGYSFKVFQTSNDLVSQTAEVARVMINFYCNATADNGELKIHRVMIAYESSKGQENHTDGKDIVTDMKVPLVFPRFEALRGDMRNGELRMRDIAFLDTNAYYLKHDNGVAALAISP
ncbi:MAG: hypothetical protein OYH77_01745 [Pseudomonadota bacterium]|nr:hypothetical protein [Pseudomonadota bacterium]